MVFVFDFGFYLLFFLPSHLCQLFFSPFPFFSGFVLPNNKNRWLRMKFHSEPCELWCSPHSQILQGVLNWRSWCLLLIAQSISLNWSKRWHRSACQNVSCSSRCTAHPVAKGAGKGRLSSSSLGRIIYLPLMHAERGRTPGCVNLCSCAATIQQRL